MVRNPVGTDKPDLCYGLELVEISDLDADSRFDVFIKALGGPGQIRRVRAPGCAAYSRRQLDELQEIARGGGARGAILNATPGGTSNGCTTHSTH